MGGFFIALLSVICNDRKGSFPKKGGVVKYLIRLGYAALAISTIIFNIALSGVIVASVRLLGPWAYPAHFGFGMLCCGIVLLLLLPPSRKGLFASKWGHKFTLSEGRFAKGFWPRVRARGPFVLVLVANVVIGPFFASLVIRFLGLTEQKSWLYAFTTTLVGSALWVSLYLGAFTWVRTLFASIF